MTPIEVLDAATEDALVDEDDGAIELELHPGLSSRELDDFAATLPGPLPGEIRELLSRCGGFEFGPIEVMDFRGRHPWANEDVFPNALPLCSDGFGNFWIVDVRDDGSWGPVFFACHDPPVFVLQAPGMSGFLVEVFNLGRPAAESSLDAVRDEHAHARWASDEAMLTVAEAVASDDEELQRFAGQLDPQDKIADLRDQRVGAGFAWARHGADTEVVRLADRLLFAVKAPPKRRGVLSRLFGR